LYLWDEFSIFVEKQRAGKGFRIGKKPAEEPKVYRNVVREAFAYKDLLSVVGSQAALAEKLSVSRAKVTQILNLLGLDQEILEFMHSLDETDAQLKVLTERKLRHIVKLPLGWQKERFLRLIE